MVLKRIIKGAVLIPLLFILWAPLCHAGVIQEMDGIFKSAQIHYNLGDLPKALEMFKELRRRDATFRGREVQLYIAECYEAMAKLPEALKEYQRFITRFPSAPSVPRALIKLVALKRVLGQKMDLNQLTQQLWKAVQSSPKDRAAMLYNLSLLEREAKEFASAQLFEAELKEGYPRSVGAFWLSH